MRRRYSCSEDCPHHHRGPLPAATPPIFELTIDHIIPRSRGGRTAAENLCAACFACNQGKGDRTPEEARMPLLPNPAALTYGMDRAVMRHAAKSRPEWRK